MRDDRTRAYVAAALAANRLELPEGEIAKVATQYAKLEELARLIADVALPESIETPLEFQP